MRLNLSPILRKGCDMGIFSRRRRGFTSVEDEGVIAVPACTVEKLRKKLSKLFHHFFAIVTMTSPMVSTSTFAPSSM
jgi:hypothetical protein